jgi:CRP-like cAMP-binding protein
MRTKSSDRNAFLAEISSADYELFRPHLTSFNLTAGERLQDFGRTVEHVVFPHGGLIALTIPLLNGGGGGALLLGRDSILGAFGAASAAPAMCDAEVYIPGRASHMPASAFRSVLDHSPTLRRLAARYNAALMVEAHQTALCNAAHSVEARISRCLLEVQDRCGGTDIPLTQTTLAQMLGVQRTTINLAAGHLEAAGIIKCRRGYMQMIRREEAERHACECYRAIKSHVSRLFALPTTAVLAAPSRPATTAAAAAQT